MRTIVVSRLVACAVAFAAPARAEGPVVTVTVVDPQGRSGTVFAGLFDAEGWRTGRAVRGASGPPGAALRFSDVPPGRYAVRLYLDRDGDGRLDTGPFGIPSEPYGFSRDAPVRFGPPAFVDAAVEIGANGAALEVRLR